MQKKKDEKTENQNQTNKQKKKKEKEISGEREKGDKICGKGEARRKERKRGK